MGKLRRLAGKAKDYLAFALKKCAKELLRYAKVLLKEIKPLLKSVKKNIKRNIKKNTKKSSYSPENAEEKAVDAEETESKLLYLLKPVAGVFFVFSVIICISIVAGKIDSANDRMHQYYADAGNVCTNIISEYGSCKIEAIDRNSYQENSWRFTGLCYVRQMDFNGDGDDELIVAYNDGGIYFVEVWGYDGGEFIKLYSEKANSIEEDDSSGSWITICSRSGKYYLGRISEDDSSTIELLALKGKKFKETNDTCEYDYIHDLYAVDGVINSTDFETIKLSRISASKAERIQETVLSNLSMFETKEITVTAPEKTDEQKKSEAYYAVIEKQNASYGKAEFVSESSLCYAAGVAVVDLIDFNADGNEELLIISRRNKSIAAEDANGDFILETEPEYYMEIYSWNGTSAKMIFEAQGLSTYQNKDNSEVFYILQNADNGVNVCTNSYVYSSKSGSLQKATSRISKMNSDGVFETDFVAVKSISYGYSTYSIDGERVYRREFNSRGYAVPYFCNEDEYDKNEFTVTFLQGKTDNADGIQTVVTNTQNVIKSLNPRYSIVD